MRPRARDSLISWLIVGPFAILLAFLLSGAGLALLLTGVFGGRSAGTAGPVTGSPPTFTTIGDRWTIKTEAGKERSADLVFTIEK